MKINTKHVLSADQFTRAELDSLFDLADSIIKSPKSYAKKLEGKLIAELFYEPSTRTYASFDSAMKRLGGQVTPIVGVEYSSIAKGETFEDTIMTLAQYSDAIVLRHPEVGSAKKATTASCGIPIINAGDGTGEHPTQALLDLYTIKSELGSIDNKVVTVVGDLKHGRTVHSLVQLLANYEGITVNYVSPSSLKVPKELYVSVGKSGVSQNEHEALNKVVANSDIIYVTRVQKERFKDLNEYEKLKDHYIITQKTMQKAKDKMALMHPLPRVGEIDPEVDSDPRSAYFRQAKNGMYVRMALLLSILGD